MAGKYVKVLYDLDYKTHEGVSVSIREGEKCLLLKKTNADWWSVIREGDKKPIYVPANYVEDIVPATSPKPIYAKKQPVPVPPKPKPNGNVANQEKDSKENEKDVSEKESDHKDSKVKKENAAESDKQEEKGTEDSDKKSVNENDEDDVEECEYVNVQELKKQFNTKSDSVSENLASEVTNKRKEHVSAYEPAEYANLAAIQESIHAKKQPNDHEDAEEDGPSSDYTNVAELQKSMHSLPPPAPEEGVEPVKILDDEWGGYADPKTGRMFYFNKVSRETTWKPPRVAKPSAVSPGLNVQVPAPDSPESKQPAARPMNTFGTSAKLSGPDDDETEDARGEWVHDLSAIPPTPPPQTDRFLGTGPDSPITPGWKEGKTETGEVFFVNEITSDKWFSSLDEGGQRYFYKEGGGESAWQLPERPVTVKSPTDTDHHPSTAVKETNIELKKTINNNIVEENGKPKVVRVCIS